MFVFLLVTHQVIHRIIDTLINFATKNKLTYLRSLLFVIHILNSLMNNFFKILLNPPVYKLYNNKEESEVWL